MKLNKVEPVYNINITTATAATSPIALDATFPAEPVAIGDPVGNPPEKVAEPDAGAVPDGTGTILIPVPYEAEDDGATGDDCTGGGCTVTVTGGRLTVKVIVEATQLEVTTSEVAGRVTVATVTVVEVAVIVVVLLESIGTGVTVAVT